MVGTGGGVPGSLMFTAGFDFSKAEAQATTDVNKIIDNLQRKLDSKKLSAKIDFGTVGDFDTIIRKIGDTIAKIKDAESAFKAMSAASASGGGIGTASDLEKTAKQIELLTFRLNEYIAKLDEVATKKKTTASAGLSEEDKAKKAAEERERIMALENNTLDNIIAKRKILNKELSTQVKGTPEYADTAAQLDKINAIYEQMKREIKEVSTATATEEKKILKELEAEEKARHKQWEAIRKTVDILKQEENSLSAISAKIRVYQQYMNKAEYGSEMWNKAKAQVDRLVTAYERLKISIVEAMSAQLKSINNLNAQLGAYTNRLNAIQIGSSEWKTMALNIRDVSAELARANQHLADFQSKAFQGLSHNFTKDQVAELQRLRTEIADIDARVNRAYQGALRIGTPEAMRVTMVDINRELDRRIKLEEQIARINTSSADLQAKRQKEINAIIEKRNAKRDREAAEARQVQQTLAARKQERAILNQHERSIDNITKKLQIQQQRLNSAKFGSSEFDKIIKEVERLTKKLQEAQNKINELTGKTTTSANTQANSLKKVTNEYGRQEQYLRNLTTRLATYASIGALGGFLQRVREVTAQFELQRVSLGAIIQDQNRANQLFSEIKSFALKSPVKILDLTKYVKQVAAYRIETDKLFDTTKRLADVSVGLGVDMQRIVLAYGQVKAASYLRAAEVRQFTEAGIPLLELLAEKFSKVRGEMVSTADVMDMISKRGVEFSVIEDIFKDMTDAGGIFYNMQEKQGNTLFGMWAKLGDAASVMYDQMGNTGSVNNAMKGLINLLTELMRNWKAAGAAMTAVGILAGGGLLYKRLKGAGENVLNKQVAIATNEVTKAQTQLSLAYQSNNKAAIANAKATLQNAQAKEKNAIATRNLATESHKASRGFTSLMSSLASGLGFGLIITAITGLAYELKKAWDDAHRLKNELADIDAKGIQNSITSVRNFQSLVGKALDESKGAKSQKDALEELQRTYKDMIPIEDLTIEKLRALNGNYETLTDAIQEYIAVQTKQQKIDAVNTEFGAGIVKSSRKLKDYMIKTLQMSDIEAERVINNIIDNINKSVERGDKKIIWGPLINESFKEAGLAIDKEAIMDMMGYHEGFAFWYSQPMAELLTYQTAMAAHIKQIGDEAADATGKLGAYQKVWDALMKSVSQVVSGDTFTEQQKSINESVKRMAEGIQEMLVEAGADFKDEWFDIVVAIENNDLGHITTIQFDKILDALGTKYPQLKETLKKIRAEYDKMIPDQTVITLRKRFQEIANQVKANMDNVGKHWMKAGEDVEGYKKRLTDTIDELRKKLLSLAAVKRFTKDAEEIAEFDKLEEQYKKELEFIEKVAADLPDFSATKTKSGSKSDDRLSLLNEIEQALTTINSKYDEMLKKEGDTKALRDINEIYGNQLKYINDIAKTIKGVKLPTFEMPTDYIDLRNYREQILKAIETLKNSKVKGARKAALELEMKIGTEDWKKTEEIIEKRLKELSERISQSKTAKEFYDKILTQTGDVDVAASVTMSIYGDTGEGLFEQTIAQIREVFASGVEGIDIPIDTAFDFTNNVIDYGKLAKIYEQYQDQLVEANKSTALKIVQEGQKTAAQNVLTWQKELAKAKDFEEQRTDIINRETQRRADIIKSNIPQQMKDQLLQLSYDKQAQDLAGVNVKEFQASEDYIKIFENLDRVSTNALKRLRNNLAEIIQQNKDLNPENMKQLVKALEQLDNQIEGRGFGNEMIEGVKEYIASFQKLKQARIELQQAQAEYAEQEIWLNGEIEMAQQAQITAQEELNRLRESGAASAEEIKMAELAVNQATEAVVKAQQKKVAAVNKVKKKEQEVTDAEDEQLEGQDKFKEGMLAIAQTADKFASVLGDIKDLLGVAEDSAAGVAFDSAIDGLERFSKILTTIVAIQELYNIVTESNPWIAIAAAVLAVGSMLGSWISNEKVRKANKEIERQADLLHDLEYAYDRLQKAQEKLFGTEYIQNYNSQLANLEAQAQAYRKQYEAEKSKGKKADKEQMQNYEDSWRETMDEIKDMRDDLQEYLLGTDITSAARDFANSWLEARWSFEDTTQAMKENFADMVQNMIVESMAAKIMENVLSPVFEAIDEATKDKSAPTVEQMKSIADLAFSSIGTMNSAMEGMLAALEEAGMDLANYFGTGDSELTGISRDIATASEESINGLAQGVNTMNYYMSHVPTIGENVAAIRLLMEGGAGVPLGDGGGLIGMQNEHLAQLPMIAANTLATAERCERAAMACEAIQSALERAITPKGGKFVVNTMLN